MCKYWCAKLLKGYCALDFFLQTTKKVKNQAKIWQKLKQPAKQQFSLGKYSGFTFCYNMTLLSKQTSKFAVCLKGKNINNAKMK